jgi:EAL domain-containing protein (putative c-di-GMP-specific phosphodiesterase class I)
MTPVLPSASASSVEEKGPEEKARSGAGFRVLVVDDEPDMLRGCADVLEALGYTVETAPDGQHALDALASRSYDVVVSDICMPGADGIQLLRAVREKDLDLPVVMMTGSPEVATAIKAIEFGAMRYLVKPFSLQDLEHAVEQASRLSRLARVRREALAVIGVDGAQVGDLAGLETSFTRALRSLWMAFQPIQRAPGNELFGYEALVRTTEPTLPHPGALFAASEKLGRVIDLGRAIRAAVAQTIAEGKGSGVFFVNLHPRDLGDEDLYRAAAPLSRFAPRVVLEITERASIDKITNLPERMQDLRRLGYRLAVDDLGSGYAGLTRLAQIEPEVVKLDMGLVRNAHNEPVKRKLIGSVTGLAREMGTLVVAEGIETVEEKEAMVKLGCHLLQGYLIGKPDKLA